MLLDSQLNNPRGWKAHDFRVNFNPPILLNSNRNYRTTVNRLITMTYSWYNVGAAFNKNQLKWRKATDAWKTVVFPDGMYDYEKLNGYLQAETGFVDLLAEEKTPIFNLRFDST